MKTNKSRSSVEDDDLKFTFQQRQVSEKQIAEHWQRIRKKIFDQQPNEKDSDKETE